MSATDKINSLADSINKRDMDAFAGHWAADVVVYSPHLPEPLRGRDAVTENMATFQTGFGDLKVTLSEIIDDGNRTATQMVFEGTMTGPLPGPQGEIPATHKRVVLKAAGFQKFNSQGLITEERRYYDVMGMMAQLGLMPGGYPARHNLGERRALSKGGMGTGCSRRVHHVANIAFRRV